MNQTGYDDGRAAGWISPLLPVPVVFSRQSQNIFRRNGGHRHMTEILFRCRGRLMEKMLAVLAVLSWSGIIITEVSASSGEEPETARAATLSKQESAKLLAPMLYRFQMQGEKGEASLPGKEGGKNASASFPRGTLFIPDEELDTFFDGQIQGFLLEHLYSYPHGIVDFMLISDPGKGTPAAAAGEENPEEKEEESEELVHSFADDVASAFLMLRKESPALFEKLEGMDRKELLQRIFEASGSGVRPLDGENALAEFKRFTRKRSPGIFPPRMIFGNRILYLRLERISMDRLESAAGTAGDKGGKGDSKKEGKEEEEGKDGLEEELRAVSRLAFQPLGIIVDLRDCDGDGKAALKLLSFFCSAEQLGEAALFPESRALFNLPVAVLISGETSAGAEIFASLIEKFHQGITIGETTAGHPVPLKMGQASGVFWLVPDIPLSLIEPHAHTPMIEAPIRPRIDFAKLSGTAGLPSSDPALSRAADLLLSLDALKDRRLLQHQQP